MISYDRFPHRFQQGVLSPSTTLTHDTDISLFCVTICDLSAIYSTLLINHYTTLWNVTKSTHLPFFFFLSHLLGSPSSLFWCNTSAAMLTAPTASWCTQTRLLRMRGAIMRHELWRTVIWLVRGCLSCVRPSCALLSPRPVLLFLFPFFHVYVVKCSSKDQFEEFCK